MEEEEIWLPVVGYEALYEVSSFGRVKRLWRTRIKKNPMKSGISNCGYLKTYLSSGGVSKTFSTHRLVAQAFILNPENKPQVNHIDHNKLNNRIDNLEWCTAKENISHSKRAGRRAPPAFGEKNQSHKFSNEQVLNILADKGLKRKVIAKKYNISLAHVYNILGGYYRTRG